jgi:[ribosomal protein S18]-alanine N-acetyltransferase
MNPPTKGDQAGLPACQVVRPEHAGALACFFERLRAYEIEKFFHPHPLTVDEATRRAAYRGLDFYCVLAQDTKVVGYGMLRGWDDCYQVPSLGIVIDPSVQGRGYGRLLMEFLHTTARQRGASRIRLKVYPDNLKAVRLYRSLGYEFQGPENDQLIGILNLNPPPDPSPEEIAR